MTRPLDVWPGPPQLLNDSHARSSFSSFRETERRTTQVTLDSRLTARAPRIACGMVMYHELYHVRGPERRERRHP